MPAFRNRSVHQGSGSGNLTSTITLANPAGMANGDFLIAVLSIGFGTNALSVNSAPAGWTLVLSSGPMANGSGSYNYVWIYVKSASTEPGSWSWGLNNSVAFYNCTAIAFSDVNTAQAYEQLGAQSAGNVGNGTQLTDSAVTTVTNESVISIFAGGVGTGGMSWSEDAGTEVFDSIFGNNNVTLNMLSAPTPGTYSVTGTVAVSANGGIAMLQLALLPAIITVGKSLAQPYTAKALAGKSLAMSWTGVGTAGRSLALAYITRVFSPKSLGVPFVVRVPVGRSLALVYPVRITRGKTLEMPYGLAFAVPIPGKSGIDTYSDGASSPFGLAVNEASDLSIFATFVSIPWYPPEGLEEMHYGRLPHFEAQAVFELSPIDTKSVRRARAGWHGTKFDRERGSFAIVALNGPLSDLVGERLLLTFSDLPSTKSIFVYVHDEAVLADDADISLPRREFLALALPYVTTVDVNVEVAG